MKEATEQELLEFINAVGLLNPIEFLGVATLLHVPCFDDLERKHPRIAEDLFGDMMDNYIELSHTKRKEIIKQIKKAGKKRKKNGGK